MSRRSVLAGAGAFGALAVTAGCGSASHQRRTQADNGAGPASPRIPFFGRYQAGVATPQQAFLYLGAFDLDDQRQDTLRDLLRSWSDRAAEMTAGREAGASPSGPPGPPDTGEAEGLPPSALTVTFGLGPTLFERNGGDPLGLRARRPAFVVLPDGANEAEKPRDSGGDLAIQVCADDPSVAFHAMHVLQRAAAGAASPRWLQSGFRDLRTRDAHGTHRNLLGFKDGTDNPAIRSAELARVVWVDQGEAPAWMRNGTYLVARRFRFLFDVWDATELAVQEQTIGRRKSTGAPLSGTSEHDPVDLDATRAGQPIIPTDAHIRQASAASNGGAKLLRRSFNYSNGIDEQTGQLDAGLQFISFQRDPERQFARIQRRLAQSDALNRHVVSTSSAIFACPPGPAPGGFVGETLFEHP